MKLGQRNVMFVNMSAYTMLARDIFNALSSSPVTAYPGQGLF